MFCPAKRAPGGAARKAVNVRSAWLAVLAVIGLATVAPRQVGAVVTAAEAAKLGAELTPMGAERSANHAGTIPPWQGEASVPAAGEQPRYRVNAQNMGQHAKQLSEGTKALLTRFRSYRIDVYPTHRTATAPQWVYDNTLKNATRARTSDGGIHVEGTYGGIPFPIPKTGAEAMWNHLLTWKGEAIKYDFRLYVVIGGQRVLATGATTEIQYPYYRRGGTLEQWDGLLLGMTRMTTREPPFRAGEDVLIHEPVSQAKNPRRAWQYLVGQRRVRRAPTISYDNPNFYASGLSLFDEVFVFNGALDRYDWRLLGKQEMLVPYNTQALHAAQADEVLGPDHLSPAKERWELHRVWVVEGTLARGKRHVIPRRRLYLDEDSWNAVMSDGWDASGKLWHVSYALPFVVAEIPAVVAVSYVTYDLAKGGYTISAAFGDAGRGYRAIDVRPDNYFTPDALAGAGIR